MFKKTILAVALGLAFGHCHAQIPVCTVTPNKAALVPDEVLILTASCAPVATSYAWTGPGIPSVTAVPSVLTTAPSLSGTYVYTVAGVNATGQSLVATTSVAVGATTVPAPPTPPPPSPSPSPSPAPSPAPSVSALPPCSATYVEPTNLAKADIALTGAAVNGTLVSGKIYAWKFVPTLGLKVARVEMTSDNYIDGKDVVVSACPGDFAGTLPNECTSRLMGATMLMLDVDSTFAQQRCHLIAGSPYYVNVRMSYATTGSIITVKAREFR